jgi:hypothetical protein
MNIFPATVAVYSGNKMNPVSKFRGRNSLLKTCHHDEPISRVRDPAKYPQYYSEFNAKHPVVFYGIKEVFNYCLHSTVEGADKKYCCSIIRSFETDWDPEEGTDMTQ